MLCQECKKNQATVHFTKIVNNKKTEIHLCQECAKKSGEFDINMDPGFSFQNFLAGLMDAGKQFDSGQTYHTTDKTGYQCDQCNLTYNQFAQVGRFGCSNCYNVFSENLEPLLKKIHGSAKHAGKVPKRTGGNLRIKREIEELKKKLQECVEKEEYERAAELRDKIKQKEKELK